MIKEYLLSVDKFDNPKEIKDKNAIYLLLKRLIILTPGSVQTHPEMGVGIHQWRYMYYDDLDLLEHRIYEQIETYLPQFQDVQVKLKPSEDQEKEIQIDIAIDNTLYRFETEKESLTIKDLNV